MNIEITEAKTYVEITEEEAGTVSIVETMALPGGSVPSVINFTATDRILGRSSAGAGVGEEIVCTSAGRALLDDANAAAQRTTLGLGSLATLNSVPDESVTYAKMQHVSATDKILGRSSAGAGDVEEIACTAFGRSILDDADAATARTTLGAKYDNVSATDKILGRSSAGAGAIEEITCTSAGRALLDDAAASDQRTTLGLGSSDSPTFTNVDATGTSIGLIPILNDVTAPTTAQCRGQIIRMSATGTVVLPAVVIGASLTVFSLTAAAVMVDPDNSDRIILDGVAGGNGKKITSASGAGDHVTLFGDSADGWTVIGRSGTWTMES